METSRNRFGMLRWVPGGRRSREALSYPTPNLETLVFRGVIIHSKYTSLFPDTNRLKSIILLDCYIKPIPNFVDIQTPTGPSTWENEEYKHQNHYLSDQIIHAINLCLASSRNSALLLPPKLPKLAYLHIVGEGIPVNLYDCQMPSLYHVSLRLRNRDLIDDINKCQGLPVGWFSVVSIAWKPPPLASLSVAQLLISLEELLRRYSHVGRKYVGGKIRDIIVRLLWSLSIESRSLLIGDGKETVNADTLDKLYIGDGEDDGTFESLARNWSLQPPNLPLNEFRI